MSRKHFYLTGFMGAGKSKIGPLLAEKLQCRFYDSDHIIEIEAGKKIFDIFEEDGETAFRDHESAVIKKLSAHTDPSLIALGGGALNRKTNFELIHRSGRTIYIKSSPEAIFQRIRHSRKRPLLKLDPGPDYDDRLLKRIDVLLKSRETLYHKADFVFNRDNLPLEDIVEQIYRKLKEEFGV